jgi:transcriptional regulator with GAF, ATPase, and Fis domain/tetratricopeptide (TPR) repeat protein
VAWVEAGGAGAREALTYELAEGLQASSLVLLLDDAGLLGPAGWQAVREARAAGARLVFADVSGSLDGLGPRETVHLPPLDGQVAAGLLRRAIPSLGDAVAAHLVARAEGRPGKLRALVRRLDGQALVTPADVDRALDGEPGAASVRPGGEVAAAHRLLDQGRIGEAQAILGLLAGKTDTDTDLVRLRLALLQNDLAGAERLLDRLEALDLTDHEPRRLVRLHRARWLLRRGQYPEGIREARRGLGDPPAGTVDGELLACIGVAESYLGQHDAACATLGRAVELARRGRDRRVEALALASLAMTQQRGDQLAAACEAYEQALAAAEEVGDAGTVATLQLNLAVLESTGQGEVARALAHLEAAVDMGRKAGRTSTVQQALLNLANLDLNLGRVARAAAGIEALAAQRAELPESQQAQLLGLEADLAARGPDLAAAAARYERCALAYEALGRPVDAAEARIEAALVAVRAEGADPGRLTAALDLAEAALGPAPSHRAPLLLARGLVASLARDDQRARDGLAAALAAAQENGQREWIWRALDARARLELDAGRPLASRRDAEQALTVLEDLSARLPRDLREVFWNDPRRRGLRALVAPPEPRLHPAHGGPGLHSVHGGPGLHSAHGADRGTRALAEDRLSRILEINRDLAVVRARSPLLDRVLDHAITLVLAERGYVLLLDENGQLAIHASRGLLGDESHRSFSKSIAERAIVTGEPLVTTSARDDASLAGYESVHVLQLQSVACVPIRSPRGGWIGALYLETRSRQGHLFEREAATLRAFADQAAIAIENARLLEEDARRSEALARSNRELEATQAKLRDLLDAKRAQLDATRKDLKDTRAVLRGHFGYQGLVGTSARMRHLYAVIDRVKDTDVPVLITGESGTGKEMVARAIHDAGPRARHPFTGLNCGAIPENLLESELFGHVRGAFTGADRDRRGLFREAEGGTLLLDEIGEMPARMQAGLLRVLQEKLVRPVGGSREEPVDVRVIAATHRDLLSMSGGGQFREDLYYRLRVVEINVPALRDRPEDIPALIDHFLQLFAARYRRERGVLSREALRALSAYGWPGNVRQLQNALLNAWVLSDSSELEVESFDLPGLTRPAAPPPRPAPPRAARPESEAPRSPITYADHRADEKDRMLDALRACNWNRVRAAEVLQMPRRTFYRRLKEYGIQLSPGPRRKGLLGPRFPCDAVAMVSWRVWSLGLWAVVSLACAQAASGNESGGGDAGAAGDSASGGDGGSSAGGSSAGGSGAGAGGVSGKGGAGGAGGKASAGSGQSGAGQSQGGAGSGQAGAGGAAAGSTGAAGQLPGGAGGSSPGMLDGALSKPPPSATTCQMEGMSGGDCAVGLVCRIYSEHDGRCEGCSPCSMAGKACSASVQCAIDSQCYGGVCRELCSLATKGCKQGGVCKDIGNQSAGLCVP